MYLDRPQEILNTVLTFKTGPRPLLNFDTGGVELWNIPLILLPWFIKPRVVFYPNSLVSFDKRMSVGYFGCSERDCLGLFFWLQTSFYPLLALRAGFLFWGSFSQLKLEENLISKHIDFFPWLWSTCDGLTPGISIFVQNPAV